MDVGLIWEYGNRTGSLDALAELSGTSVQPSSSIYSDLPTGATAGIRSLRRTKVLRYRIAPMVPPRLLILLVGFGVALALSSLSGPAWAHPGHDSIGGAGAGTSAGVESPDQGETGRPIKSATGSWNGLRQQIPSATVPVALAVFFLALMPHRRGALALSLVLLFGVVSFEGVFHAVLHLHHVRHADSLAIGASTAQPAASLATEEPGAVPEIVLAEVAERYDSPASDIVFASNRGRAPPISPA